MELTGSAPDPGRATVSGDGSLVSAIRLREAGCKVMVVAPRPAPVSEKLGYPRQEDKAAQDVSANDFDLVVIPGGFAPDSFRRTMRLCTLQTSALSGERGWDRGAHAICHGPLGVRV